MAANIAFNPNLTTNGAGSFNIQSTGYVQGQAQDDPSTRWRLRGGILSSAATLVMWGGVGVSALIPGATGAPTSELGPVLDRATTLTAGLSGTLLGFSVFDQDNAMIETPQSPVPTIGSGGRVHYYPLGSLARVAVKCSPNLVNLLGEALDTPVSWDFTDQLLVPYSAPTFSSGTYTSGTGVVSLTTAAAHGLLPGDAITVSAATGTGSFASINGTFILGAGTTGTTLNYTIATGLTLTITGATLSTGGVLPVSVLDVQIGNSMTVNYDSTTGFATWNRSGNAAIIQI